MNPYNVVRDFERAVADYTGTPHVVAVNSCSAALMLAVAWHLRWPNEGGEKYRDLHINIPKRTYLSVPMSIIHAGGRPTFRDEEWLGAYPLLPLNVWDSARWFTSDLWRRMPPSTGTKRIPADRGMVADGVGMMICTSHHWSKTLGIQQGGCILHDDPEADAWLRRARFDGRTEGVAPKDDNITQIGFHCYMSPEVAAEGLVRLHFLPKHNAPLPNDEYPDLSQLEIFR
jgi:dTDP-4-amino-4,6-dideoxygalactose transaminase